MELYDHVFNIINKNKKFSELTKKEQDGFSKFMVNKVFSMDFNLVDLSENNNKILDLLDDETFNDSLQRFIPNGDFNLSYKKSKKDDIDEDTVNRISKYFKVPYRDAIDYYHSLSEEAITEINRTYGIDNEEQ